ncbi:MAG: peptidoglycan DD-metalloendopeptidase family protein [Saprospiraceae bacterium]
MRHRYLLTTLLILILLPAIQGQDYPWETPASPCIPAFQDTVIWQQVRKNEKLYHVSRGKRSTTRFIWPLRFAQDTTLPGYYAIYQFVDHDPDYGEVLDYNCGKRTYDLENYNHAGTDIGLYPWGWRKLDEGTIAVIAAAAGTITGKDDGHYDRNCSWGNNPPANYVIITHADGSRALYWHMKEGSITGKPIGSTIEAGEYLGRVASSGFSNIPHLHFEIRSSEGNVVDPWAGPCNETTATSWWIEQRPYYDPAINEIDIHYAAPSPFGSCPDPENTRISRRYNPGSDIFPATYYRDQRKNDITEYVLLDPEGKLFKAWTHRSPGDYLTSWWYWQYTLPDDALTGTWTLRVSYRDQELTWPFEVTNDCLLPEELQVLKPGVSSAELQWSASADQYVVRIFKNGIQVNDTLTSELDWKPRQLEPATAYQWEVASICNQDTSAYTPGPSFSTTPIYYFQGQNITISPANPLPTDSILVTISGLILEEGAYVRQQQISQDKAVFTIRTDWSSSDPTPSEKKQDLTFTLAPQPEGDYQIALTGEHADYTFLASGNFQFTVNGCKEIPLYISALSDRTLWWDIGPEYGLDQYIIRYRPSDLKEWTYDTLTYPFCLVPPCPGIGTGHLEDRLGQWLIRGLQPCQEYEIQLFQPCVSREGNFSRSLLVTTMCEPLPCHPILDPVLDTTHTFGASIHWQDTTAYRSGEAYLVRIFQEDSLIWEDALYSTPDNRHYREHHVKGRYFVNCYCQDGFCLRPPLILPAPTFYNVSGLLPCTSYQVTTTKWCIDTLLPSQDTLDLTTSCRPDPYFAAENAIQIYEPQAAQLDSIQIQGEFYSNPCVDCKGCPGQGYHLWPDTIAIIDSLRLAWRANILGGGQYVDLFTNLQESFPSGNMGIYVDEDQDGYFERVLFETKSVKGSGETVVPLTERLLPGNYRLRWVWSPLEKVVAQGYLHFGSVFDLPVKVLPSTTSRESEAFLSVQVTNPVRDRVTLFHLPEGTISIDLFDLLGHRMLPPVRVHDQPVFQMDVSQLRNGLYVIQLQNRKGRRAFTLMKME